LVPDYEATSVTMQNGDRFSLEVGGSIAIVRVRGDRREERVEFPYPRAGFGEGALTLSSSERLLLFSYFSGQSEEAYRLIATEPQLQELGSCPYMFGEAASYAFSPHEKAMLMALPASCTPWEVDELEEDRSGNLFLEFGLLRIHRIVDDVATHHSLRAYFEQAWEPNRGGYDPDMKPEIDNEGNVTITLPSGRMQLAPPISDVVELRVGHPRG
jgi:hypothetical protein